MALDLDLQSYEEILNGMIRSLQSRVGLSDDTIGSVTLNLLESAAQSDFLVNSNILAALDSISIDRATGVILDNIGFSESLRRVPSSKASGPVTVTDTSFSKVSTQIYPNRAPPIAGATILYINDGASFPSTGQVYVGRGTAQTEGPLAYSAIAQVGAYYQLTLTAGLNKSHNTGETVILSQGGNRTVAAGTSIQTPASGASAQVLFTTVKAAIIQDGETSVSGISVLATKNGTTGNIPANTLTSFVSLPFPNATVANTSPFSNATDVEPDFEFRERIKQTRQARSRGTNVAIINSVLNLVAIDEQKRVSSAAIEEAASASLPTILRIDDGTAYEPIFSGIGNEIIIDSALGGEDKLQLNSTPVVKAQLTTVNVQPFAIYDDAKLSILVGGELSEHSFQVTDFKTEGAATAYEVVASINANTELLFSARTASGANKVTILAKADSDEDLIVTAPSSGTDSNEVLAFPESHQYTLLLYKNDELLTKDGSEATILTRSFPWNLSLTSYSLEISVDGTPYSTYTFNSSNLTPYTPANAPLNVWVDTLNATVPGISAISINNVLQLKSNKGATDAASLSISASSTLELIGNIFTTLEAEGRGSDYSLIRGKGQIKLAVPASEGDNFKAGTENFQAYFETEAINGGAFNLSTTGTFWMCTDSSVEFISTPLVVGSTLSVTGLGDNLWAYNSVADTFGDVQVGDWLIVWDESLDSTNIGHWRIAQVDSDFVVVEKQSGTDEGVTLTNAESVIVVRTDAIVQSVVLPSGSYSLAGAVTALNNLLVGANASVVNGNKLRISTNTYTSNGAIALCALDTSAAAIGFGDLLERSNGIQHVAAIESGNSERGLPLFQDALYTLASSAALSLTKVFVATEAQTISPDKMISFLKPLTDEIPSGPLTDGFYSSNQNNHTGIRNYVSSATSITLVVKTNIQDVLALDRAFVTNGYDFSFDDKLNIVIDDAPETNTLILPLYRELAIASSPSPTVNSFNATDVDGGNLSMTATFGAAFDFGNYRLWSRARQVVNPSGTNNAMIVRSAHYGPTGNRHRFSIQFPLSANTAISTGTSVTLNGTIDNILILPSDPARSFAVSATATGLSLTAIGGPDYSLYITTTGNPPNFVSSGVIVGDILNFPSTSAVAAANRGSFRITAVSQTSLTVHFGYNTPTNQSVSVFLTSADFSIFPLLQTTANVAISTINNSPLNQNITASLGVGEDGTGPIFTCTQDDESGAFISLVDGENWIRSASLTASPQFSSEVNFTITSSLYTIVGERVRVIPYTAKQTSEFLSSNAVSGINNIAGLKQTEQGNKIQLNSQNFGTLGAVKVASGAANAAGGTIVGGSVALTNSRLLVRTTQGATDGLHANSWIKITSGLPLNKSLNFNTTASLQIVSSTYNLQIVGGTSTFNASLTVYTPLDSTIAVEKVGDLVAYSYLGSTAPDTFYGYEGAWLQVSTTSGFSAQNQGDFRVIRSTTATVWVENSIAVEERVVISYGDELKLFSDNSIMAGDSIIIAGDLMGASNNGTYTVESVSATSLTVSISTPFATTSAPVTLGADFNNFSAVDSDVTNFYKQVYTLQDVSSLTSTLADLVLLAGTTSFDAKISDVFECVFSAQNKLDFDTKTLFGVDSYLAYEGLIKEASRVVYGLTSNPNTYPGVKAAGAYIDIQPPLPRKITLSIGIRPRTGVSLRAIQNNVKSVAAGVINATPIGQSVSLSDVLGAVRGIEGIFAVSLISPVYNSENDVIIIYPSEKPICDSGSDVSVTLLGG